VERDQGKKDEDVVLTGGAQGGTTAEIRNKLPGKKVPGALQRGMKKKRNRHLYDRAS